MYEVGLTYNNTCIFIMTNLKSPESLLAVSQDRQDKNAERSDLLPCCFYLEEDYWLK
jgi:hypothetical protein